MNKKCLLTILLILILATFPRIWELDKKPPLIVDEYANIKMIKEIIAENKFGITEFHWDPSKTILPYYPTILFFKLKNISEEKNSLLLLRLTSVIYSLISLPPFYIIVKEITDDKIALITTILFSFSYYFLQFSRVGWVDIIFIIALVMYIFLFLNTGLKKSGNIFWIFLAAIFSSFVFYSYQGGIIYILSSFIYLTSSFILYKWQFKKAFVYTLSFVIPFIIFSLPWLNKISKNFDKYSLRARVISIQNTNIPYHNLEEKSEILKYQITTSIKSWILLEAIDGGEYENARYLPLKVPPLNIFIKFSFWIGILIMILNKKIFKKIYIWPVVLFLTVFFGQIMTVDPPNGARAVIALPSYYIISSMTMWEIYKRSNKSNLVLGSLFFLSFIFLTYDLLIYNFWMKWIKV